MKTEAELFIQEGEFYACRIAEDDWVIHDIVEITQTSDTHIIGRTLVSISSTEDSLQNSWHLPLDDEVFKEIRQVSRIDHPELFI